MHLSRGKGRKKTAYRQIFIIKMCIFWGQETENRGQKTVDRGLRDATMVVEIHFFFQIPSGTA